MHDIVLGIGSRVRHPEYGDGVVIQERSNAWEIVFMSTGGKRILKSYDRLEVLDAEEPDLDVISYAQVERMFRKVMGEVTDISEVVELGDKWINGRIILEPGRPGLQSKDMPIEVFFHKIVMLRDRLRVMEQRINASELNDEEKINLQQYITRIYGTLTSFNLLFENKDDYFRGESTR
ncbi:MAG TPA: hypothetical protein P5550_12145 [Bacteroidales bacterium]|nr:hypothetical protein [Bacteroidales bacterium]